MTRDDLGNSIYEEDASRVWHGVGLNNFIRSLKVGEMISNFLSRI